MYAILYICVLFTTLLPTSTVLSIAAHRARNKLWARFWTVLAILGGLGIIALPALITALISLSISISPPSTPHGLEGLAYGVIAIFVLIAWMVQLVVIGIVALALRATKHVAAGAVAPSETPDDSLAAPAARREEVPPRRGFSWILWIGIALIALFVLTSAWWLLMVHAESRATILRLLTHVVATPLLPLALAFIVAGHRWRAHEWARFWYIVAVPGAIGLVIRLFPSLAKSGSLLHGLRPGYHEDWARIYLAIFVLTAVCCVVTLNLSLARANPMWRWAFTWATIGYVLLMLLGLALW